MTKIFQLGLLALLILYVKCDDLDYCYADDDKPYTFFSTWTPPSIAWLHIESKDNECKPIYVWSLLKHGMKSFTDDQIKRSENLYKVKTDIEKNYEEKRCTLCLKDYQNIHSSSGVFRLSKDQHVNLAKKAQSSHELFASHLRQVMETSPAFNFEKKDIEIQTNGDKEAKDSATAFAVKFLGESTVDNIITENKALLKTRSTCAKWNANHKEADDFILSSAVESLRHEVSYRLGYTYGLPMETIITMYESCVFWNILSDFHKPPFCAAFSPAHLKTLEYWQDLKHYYEFGYGNELSEKMGCGLLRDMVDKIVTASTGKWEDKQGTNTITQWSGKRVNVYFADEENIMGLITKMGLYRDDDAPKHDNYNSQKSKRKWRSSLLSPFDGSVHAILYNCKNNEKKITFYHNHDIVKLDTCNNAIDGKCPLDTFLTAVTNNFKEGKCQEEYCGSYPKKSSESGGNMIGYSFAVMIACFFFKHFF